MAGTTDLQIRITANTQRAKEEIAQLRDHILSLVKDIPKTSASTGGAGKTAVAKVAEDAEDAGKRVDKLRTKVQQLLQGFELSSKMGLSFTPEAFLKNLKRDTGSLLQAGLGKEGISEDILKEVEGYYKQGEELARKDGVMRALAVEESTKRTRKAQEALGDEYIASRRREIDAARDQTKAVETNNKKLFTEQMRFGDEWVAQRKLWLKRSLNEVLAYKKNEAAALSDKGRVEVFHAGDESPFYNNLKRDAESAGREIERYRKGNQAFLKSVDDIGKSINKVSNTEKEAVVIRRRNGEETRKVTRVLEEQDKVLRKGGWRHIGKFTEQVGDMMQAQIRWFAGAGIIFGGFAAISSATRMTMEFYQNLKNIQAITGTTDEGIRAVRDAAISVAETTPIAADEAAKFGLKLIQAGLSAEETAKAMHTVAALVTVTGEDADNVSKTITTAMFAWRKEAEDIPQIGQAIAAALNYSRLTVDDLGTAFNYLASTASLMGKSLEETISIMAVLNNMGIKASTIGTGVSQLFTDLTVPSKKFREELERIGISLGAINPSSNKFADIVDRFNKAGFSAAKAYTFLDKRAGRQLAASLVATGDAFRVMEERIRSSTQLTEGLKKAMEGPLSALKSMRNVLGITAIEIGSVAVPALKGLEITLRQLASVAQVFTSGVSAIVDAVGPQLAPYLIIGATAVTGLTATLIKYGKTALTAAGATTIFSNALAFLRLHPILTALSIGITAVGLWGKAFGKSTKEIRGAAEAQQKLLKNSAEESIIIQNRTRLEEQAVADLRDEWNRLGQAGERSGVLAGVMALVDGFHLVTTEVRALGVEIDMLEDKIQGLGDKEAEILDLISKSFIAAGVSGAIPDTEALEEQLEGISQSKERSIEDKTAKEKTQAELLKKKIVEAEKMYKSVVNVKAAMTAALREPILTEMGKLAEMEDRLQREVDARKEALGKAIAEFERFKQTYDAATATKEDKSEKKRLEGAVEDAATVFGATVEKVKELSKIAAGEIKQKVRDAAEKAVDDLETIRAELERFQYDLSQIGKKDPFASIFRSGLEEAARYEKKIRDIDRTIEDVKNAMPKAIGPLYDDLSKQLAALKEQKKAYEQMLAGVSGKTGAFVKEKQREIQLQGFDNAQQAQADLLSMQKESLDLLEQMGKISPVGKALAEFEIERQLLQIEKERLGMAYAQAMIDGDIEKRQELSLKLESLGYKQELNALKEELDALRLMAAGPGWEGFFAGLTAGVREFQAQLDTTPASIRIAKDALTTLQSSASDFFYNLSTAQGFDQEEHENFWRYFQDVVDDFLKSIWQSFSRTLSDIYTQWLLEGTGLLDWLKGFKTEQTDIGTGAALAAIGQNTLTGSIWAQKLAVDSLKESYIALGIVKQFAGMGGGSFGPDASTEAGQAYWAGAGPPGFHSGGLVMHSGGMVPKYHTGGKVLPDERLALLQTGEGVLSRRGVAALGALNSGQVSASPAQQQPTTIIINALDPKSWRDYVKRNPGPLIEAYNKDMKFAGSTRAATRRYAR